MFSTHSAPGLKPVPRRFEHNVQAAQRAQQLYERACNRNWAKWGWSALQGRSSRLANLADLRAAGANPDYRHIGMQIVQLSQIRGSISQGRCHDFDAEFRPLKKHSQERWIGIATARLRGAKLPPVDLIRVGEVYFVEDGHHRISVARQLGEQEIEARVTVWMSGSLPL